MDCHSLLQGIFPTQGWNSCFLRLLQRQADSLPLKNSQKLLGSPEPYIWDILVHSRCSINSADWMNLPQHPTYEPHHVFLPSVEKLVNWSPAPNLHASHEAVVHIILRKPCFSIFLNWNTVALVMLLNIVLASPVQQCESVVSIHVLPPS